MTQKKGLKACILLALAAIVVYSVSYQQFATPNVSTKPRILHSYLSIQPRDSNLEHHEWLRLVNRDYSGALLSGDITLEDGTHIEIGSTDGGNNYTATHTGVNGETFNATVSDDGLIAQGTWRTANGICLGSQEQSSPADMTQTICDTDGSTPLYRRTVDGIKTDVKLFEHGIIRAEFFFVGNDRVSMKSYTSDGKLEYSEVVINSRPLNGTRITDCLGYFYNGDNDFSEAVRFFIRHPSKDPIAAPEKDEGIDISTVSVHQPSGAIREIEPTEEEQAQILARRNNGWNLYLTIQAKVAEFNAKMTSVQELAKPGKLDYKSLPSPSTARFIVNREVIRDHAGRVRQLHLTYWNRSHQGFMWWDKNGSLTKFQVISDDGNIIDGTFNADEISHASAVSSENIPVVDITSTGKGAKSITLYSANGQFVLATDNARNGLRTQRSMSPETKSSALEMDRANGRLTMRIYDADGKLLYDEKRISADDNYSVYESFIVGNAGERRYRFVFRDTTPLDAVDIQSLDVILAQKYADDGTTVIDEIDRTKKSDQVRQLWKDPTVGINPYELSDERIRRFWNIITANRQSEDIENELRKVYKLRDLAGD
jgi:hypothetical protein